MTVNGGPAHDRSCLAGHASEARTALALRAECDTVAKARPAEPVTPPVVTAQVQDTLL